MPLPSGGKPRRIGAPPSIASLSVNTAPDANANLLSTYTANTPTRGCIMDRAGFIRITSTLVFVSVAAACGSSASRTSAPAPTTTVAPTTTTTTIPKPVPYDPTKPVNLAGTAGVTAAEQHRAEKLLRETIA